MTKQRIARTFPQAMTIVAGRLGYDRCAAIADRAERTIYDWAQPDGTARPGVGIALAFDAAYCEAGGDDTPFLDAFAFQLDVQLDRRSACRRALNEETAIAAIECGEAIASSIRVSQSNAAPREVYRATAEAEEAQTAIAAVLRRLTSFLPVGAGSAAGKNGGNP